MIAGGGNPNQVRHFAGWLQAGYYWGTIIPAAGVSAIEGIQIVREEYFNGQAGVGNKEDIYLGKRAIYLGKLLDDGWLGVDLDDVDDWIRRYVGSEGIDSFLGVWDY